MSTTFGVKIPSTNEIVEVAFQSSYGIFFKNDLAELLPDDLHVIPLDNSAQGIETIGDIKKEIYKEEGREALKKGSI